MTHAIQGIFASVNLTGCIFAGRAKADSAANAEFGGCQCGLGRARLAIFGGARLPNVAMILTKPLVCLVPTSDYAHTLAEPRYIVCHGEPDCSATYDHLGANHDASDTADPRLGTQIGVTRRWNSPTSVASFKFSGCAGASPHQTRPRYIVCGGEAECSATACDHLGSELRC